MKKSREHNKILEMIKKIEPDFNINENTKPVDVSSMKNVMQGSPNVQGAKERIDSPQEFGPAFKVWFEMLGFDPQENPISIAQVRNDIEQALRDLGYS